MDFFLNEQNVVERLVKEWREHGKIIIAYDYDDTVFDFHNRGETYDDVISLLQRCDKVGAHFVVSTCCGEHQYNDIKNYLYERDIPFDRINENMPFVKFTGRKIYANVTLDDRGGLSAAYNSLLRAVMIVENDKKKEQLH